MFNQGNVPSGIGGSNLPGANMAVVGPPTEPAIRERLENLVNRLHMCTTNAHEIESKIFTSLPVPNAITQIPNYAEDRTVAENLIQMLYQLTGELEDTIARVNSKL
jgi:hypothetical protein